MSKAVVKEALEDFSLRSLHLAKMTGVSCATHAIQDAFLLQHTGVGCKYKAATQFAQHDWVSHPNRREAWTQVDEISLVKGSAERIGPFARSWWDRRRSGVMIVVTAYFIELTGDDTSDYVRKTEATMPCPMVWIPTVGPNGGFFDGYASVMLALMQKWDWKAEPAHPERVGVVGHFFHRYEMDQVADVQQLQGLIKALGLDLGPVLFGGQPYATGASAVDCGVLVQLPYARPAARGLRRLLKKRRVVELDLPMGIAGTQRFLRTLGAFTGVAEARTEALIQRHTDAVRDHLGHLSNHRFKELNAWIFADTPMAAGLVTILTELGVPVRYVGLRDDVLGGKSGFFEAVTANGVDPAGIEIAERPSLRRIQQDVLPRIRQTPGCVVIGSSVELAVFKRDAGIDRYTTDDTILLEAGVPSNNHHVAHASPSLGFQGVLVWAQRILDAALRSSLGRHQG